MGKQSLFWWKTVACHKFDLITILVVALMFLKMVYYRPNPLCYVVDQRLLSLGPTVTYIHIFMM